MNQYELIINSLLTVIKLPRLTITNHLLLTIIHYDQLQVSHVQFASAARCLSSDQFDLLHRLVLCIHLPVVEHFPQNQEYNQRADTFHGDVRWCLAIKSPKQSWQNPQPSFTGCASPNILLHSPSFNLRLFDPATDPLRASQDLQATNHSAKPERVADVAQVAHVCRAAWLGVWGSKCWGSLLMADAW